MKQTYVYEDSSIYSRIGKKYKPSLVHHYWKECIQQGVHFNNPHKSITVDEYQKKMKSLRYTIKNQKKNKKCVGLEKLGGFDKLCA